MSDTLANTPLNNGAHASTTRLATEIQSSTSSSIHLRWTLVSEALGSSASSVADVSGVQGVVRGYQVHYQKVASSYVQYSHLLPPTATTYSINNLVADTYYKVCVVMYRNDTTSPDRECVDASTTSWHIPVSIGSSIGAILALSIIVLIVLLSRCPSLIRTHQKHSASESSKYDSMTSSRYCHDDHHDYISDTTTQCPDHDDEVFTDSNENAQSDCSVRHHHHHHCLHHCHHHVFLGRACNTNNPPCSHVPPESSHPVHTKRAHSVCTCALASCPLERPRPLHTRRGHLMQLHRAHESVQSEPAVSQNHAPEPRPLHVSISDLPPAVRYADLQAPVASAAGMGGASGGSEPSVGAAKVKPSIKNADRTLHMSIDEV